MITTIIISAIALCIMIAILVYQADTVDFTLKLSVLPFAIFFLYLSGMWVKENIGAPIQGIPKTEFEMIHFKMKDADTIHLWVWEEDRGSRVYAFPYNREVLKKLIEGSEQQKNGLKVEGKMTPPKGTSGEIRLELEVSRPDRTQGPLK